MEICMEMQGVEEIRGARMGLEAAIKSFRGSWLRP